MKEIKFGTEQHQKLRDAVWSRYLMSREALGERHRVWAEVEDLFRAYNPVDEEEANRQARQRTGEMTFAQVVVPFSYATLLSAHTYWSTVFLGRDPILQYTARHGEGQQKVQAVEAVIDYQVKVGEMLVPLYLWLLDAGKYGLGVLGVYWNQEMTAYSQYEMVSEDYLGVPQEPREELVTHYVAGYEGNKVYNVRPQDWFPDPRVPTLRFQDGEFCARYVEVSWNSLLKSSEEYFNLDIVRESWDRLSDVSRIDSGVSLTMPRKGDSVWSRGMKDQIGLVEMVWELVPSEWGLGESSYPEKWVITLAGSEVVIGARPLGLAHGKFPFVVLSYEMDGYSISGRGLLEILEPLERTLSWLFNSHLFNVRKALNDQIVVDPSRVVMRDLLEGGPGRLVRLNPTAYGSDVRTVVQQLPVVDITRGHLESSQAVVELIQRISGVTDNIMGLVNAGGRKTATEVRTSTSFGVNRLKTFSEFNSALGFAPLSQMLLQNTQQLLRDELMLRAAGDLMQGDPSFLRVTPEEIAGFYDFVPVDGTMPIDRFAQAMLWKEILAGLAQMPQVAATYDIAGIFGWMAQIAGLKNITQFRIMPDEALRQQVAAGNLMPAPGGLDGFAGNAAGGSSRPEVGPLAALGL